jgi:cellulose biosynthesis protein BcsQ
MAAWPLVGAISAMVNQKGGVGKTSVTLGLASAAMSAGRRVLVVDLDPQASATWVLGGDPDGTGPSAADVLDDGDAGTAVRAIQPSAWGDGVDLVPAGAGLAGVQPRGVRELRRVRRSLVGVTDDYDAVLVDCGPSLGPLTMAGLAAADLALIVVEPSALGLRGVSAVADAIDGVWERANPDLDLAGVVVNKVPGVSAEAERRLDELVRVVGRRAIWRPMIPQRVIATQAIAERRPIHSYGWRATDLIEAFDALWAQLRRRSRALR